jgi:tripartite-type tricarboxylate transporter receptor subunit TctC
MFLLNSFLSSSRSFTWGRFLIPIGVVLCLLQALQPAQAQSGVDFPTKPVKLVVAYAAGGTTDLAARRIAEDLGKELGQTVVVENKGGANGVPASEFVARSAPDGHTILVTTVPAHAGNRWAYKKLPYDTLADFIPVTVLPQQPLILVAHPSVAANNVADLIKLAKQRPGKINYASFGVGGLSHLAGVQLNLLAGTQMNHVPYKGGGPALADLMGGHVDLYFSGLATTLPLIADGKIKPIAVASATRVRSLPNVPAVAETTGFGNFEAAVTPLLLVPAKTPAAVVIKIQLAVDRAMRTEKHLALIAKSGEGEVVTTTPEQSMVMLRKELDRLALLFKAAGIEPE